MQGRLGNVVDHWVERATIAVFRHRSATIATAVLVPALVAALIIRLDRASAPLSFDEYASLYFSSHSLGDLWGWWLVRETNPPLYYTLLKAWRAIVPDTSSALRVLPLLISLTQIALLALFARRTYGLAAAVLIVAVFAVSPADIYQSEYLRAYGLAKLAVTVSFIGLVTALEGRTRGWAWFAVGAIVAIHAHTTMLLWPPIAAVAVLADGVVARDTNLPGIRALAIACATVAALSSWVLLVAMIQLRAQSGNIRWIEALSLDDYASQINLQLLLAGTLSSTLMTGCIAVGLLRTCRLRTTRLAALIVALTVVGFKLADEVHPIVSDYTMHWCMSFTALLAGAALAPPPGQDRAPAWQRWSGVALATAVIAAIAWRARSERDDVWMPLPQDWRYTVRTVAARPGAALLASHESVGVIIQQACRMEFHSGCPFRLVLMANPAPSDSWAHDGYRGTIIAPGAVPASLARAREVFVFSRYVYTPLAALGIDAHGYRHVTWDDGELIGPIPVSAFASRH